MADAYVGAAGGFVGVGTPVGGEVRGHVKAPDVISGDAGRMTSLVIEVANGVAAPSRLSSLVVEVMNEGLGLTRITSYVIEVALCSVCISPGCIVELDVAGSPSDAGCAPGLGAGAGSDGACVTDFPTGDGTPCSVV